MLSRRLAVSLVAAGYALVTVFLSCSNDATDAVAKSTASASVAAANPHEDISAASSSPAGPQLASSFELSGGDLHVSYGPLVGLPGPIFIYQDALRSLTFQGSDIHSTTTVAGTLVSVVIRRTVDTGSTTFSVLIPRVRLRSGAPAPVHTQGITAVHRLSIVANDSYWGQLDEYAVTPLQGTAR